VLHPGIQAPSLGHSSSCSAARLPPPSPTAAMRPQEQARQRGHCRARSGHRRSHHRALQRLEQGSSSQRRQQLQLLQRQKQGRSNRRAKHDAGAAGLRKALWTQRRPPPKVARDPAMTKAPRSRHQQPRSREAPQQQQQPNRLSAAPRHGLHRFHPGRHPGTQGRPCQRLARQRHKQHRGRRGCQSPG